jgi:signal transduction histidine kinase
VNFRTRLFVILSLFALVPALAVTVAWGVAVSRAVPLIAGTPAWERVTASGRAAIAAMKNTRLSKEQQAAIRAHEQELEQSMTQSRRFGFIVRRAMPVVFVAAVVGLGLLAVLASRVAGHLSRQMSRPLNEVVGWTGLIERGDPLPPDRPSRGAPEFRMLRDRLRAMSARLAEGRARALEAERLRAFRESARRVAHELKNPLTPIQFALARLKREAPTSLGDVVEVLDVETSRLDQMAKAFSQFGRLPEGPASEVDVGELARYTARATVPPNLACEVHVEPEVPMIRAHHDALQRALANVLLNAVDACGADGKITLHVNRARLNGSDAVAVEVRDTGHGIPPERLAQIWEPYVTHKPGGTGLGLAIAHQTLLAHLGRVAAESTVGEGTAVRFELPVGGVDAETVKAGHIGHMENPTRETAHHG